MVGPRAITINRGAGAAPTHWGYGLVNLRLGFETAGAGWDAFFWIKNALDQDYLQFVTVQSGNSGLVIGNTGDPRTVGVTLRARF